VHLPRIQGYHSRTNGEAIFQVRPFWLPLFSSHTSPTFTFFWVVATTLSSFPLLISSHSQIHSRITCVASAAWSIPIEFFFFNKWHKGCWHCKGLTLHGGWDHTLKLSIFTL
jgi:WD40 repeat protein